MASHIVVTVRSGDRDITLLIYRPDDWLVFLDCLKQSADVTVRSESVDELAPLIEGVVCWNIPATLLNSLTHLKWIQTTSSGADHLHDYLQTRKGEVMVSTVKGMNAATVAEFVLLSVLAHKWDLRLLLRRQQKRVWQRHATPASEFCVCAVIGLGEVGKRVASHMRALGMYVVGVSRSQTAVIPDVDELHTADKLDAVLPRADFVILSVPLTTKTVKLIGRHEFSVMKTTAYLINVSRGGVVDEAALVDALQTQSIAGASIDVTQTEPCPDDSPLWSAPNLILTSHIAGQRADYSQAAAKVWVENVHRYAAGKVPQPAFVYSQ